jgi:hypothetical protein
MEDEARRYVVAAALVRNGICPYCKASGNHFKDTLCLELLAFDCIHCDYYAVFYMGGKAAYIEGEVYAIDGDSRAWIIEHWEWVKSLSERVNDQIANHARLRVSVGKLMLTLQMTYPKQCGCSVPVLHLADHANDILDEVVVMLRDVYEICPPGDGGERQD